MSEGVLHFFLENGCHFTQEIKGHEDSYFSTSQTFFIVILRDLEFAGAISSHPLMQHSEGSHIRVFMAIECSDLKANPLLDTSILYFIPEI